jgi:hypothetical protein
MSPRGLSFEKGQPLLRCQQNTKDFKLGLMAFAAFFSWTGPGPVFGDFLGRFGPFWALGNRPQLPDNPLILLINQALSQ